jgi:phosphoribosylformimino-5-aminoimidazole carboxamide ribotide isomerase
MQGNYRYETTYSHSPVEIAQKWDSYGVKFLHVVDLEGALHGEVRNLDIVRDIARKVKAKVEFGGGVRSERAVGEVLDAGAEKVVIGTMALDEKFMKRLAERFGEKIVAAIDARHGTVHTKGWLFKSEKRVTDLAKRLEELGVQTINYTDISKDGMLVGPSLASIKELVKATKCKIVASGGVSTIDDVKALKDIEKDGLAGMIIGKALYEGRVDLAEAIKIAESPCSQNG